MIAAIAAGLLTGLSLIVAIGAQNAYVLRQGLTRSHVGAVVAICALSDLALIAAGVSGIGALVNQARWVIDVARWFGVAFLLWYAVNTLRRVFRPEALSAAEAESFESTKRVAGRALALTWLNPHVYLDTVLLLGSIAATHDNVRGGAWWFAVGAGCASVLWFSVIGYGARLLAPYLQRPSAWRVLDVVIALTMLLVAAKLAIN